MKSDLCKIIACQRIFRGNNLSKNHLADPSELVQKLKFSTIPLIVVRYWGVEMFPIICCSNNVTYWNCGCITRLFDDTMNNIGPTITAQSRPGASDLGIKTKESNYDFLLL